MDAYDMTMIRLTITAIAVMLTLFSILALCDHPTMEKPMKQVTRQVLNEEAAARAIAEKAVSGHVGTEYYNPETDSWQSEPYYTEVPR